MTGFRMVDIMAARQLGLPERMPDAVEAARSGPAEGLIDTNSGYQPGHLSATLTGRSDNSLDIDQHPGARRFSDPASPFSSTFPDFSDFSPDFPFNPVFDSNRLPSPTLPNTPGSAPVLKIRPEYHPNGGHHDPAPYQPPAPQPTYGSPAYTPAAPAYGAPTYHAPAPAYHAEPEPAYHAPAPAYGAPSPAPTYSAPAPAYHAPVGPVLLEKRPYEVQDNIDGCIELVQVKSVQPLPITVAEAYTGFDCRTKPYQGRHYADPEAGCEVTIQNSNSNTKQKEN